MKLLLENSVGINKCAEYTFVSSSSACLRFQFHAICQDSSNFHHTFLSNEQNIPQRMAIFLAILCGLPLGERHYERVSIFTPSQRTWGVIYSIEVMIIFIFYIYSLIIRVIYKTLIDLSQISLWEEVII